MKYTTRTHDVNKIVEIINKCMTDGTPVFVTDGTVTRKVIRVEKYERDGYYFNVYAEETGWIALVVNCAIYLDGYSGALYQDGFIIGPDWWHNIGNIERK